MTVVVGSAEILIKANTKAFAAEVETQTRPAFTEMEREATVAGEKSGTAMAAGMRSGGATIAAEAKAAGAAAGTGMSQHVEQGAKRSETAMVAAAGTGRKAFLGVTAAIVGTAAEGIHLAEGMQSTEAAIAGAAGTSVKAAKAVGDALLGTAGKSEFSGSVQAKAYAAVAGQLKTVEGRALSAGKAQEFMRAADDLAVAKQIDLGVAVGTTASILQAFGLKTKDAAHVTDVLYQASNATGVGVDTLGGQLTKLRSKLGDTGGSLADVAGLLVDMTEHGVTGRAAISGVTSGLTTLQKTAGAVTNAQRAQDQAFAQMPPTLQRLARSYQDGQISQADFNKATKVLTPEQKALVTTFNSSAAAVEKAQAKYKGLGIEVFDAHGKFVGMDRIIGQLGPKFAHMSQQQQIATATTLFGAGAAKQMVAVINAGPAAYEKATHSVAQHGAAQSAAAKQAKTMHGELRTLIAAASDVATEFGQVLIPAATGVIHVIASATHYVMDHRAAAIALAAVITGTLGVAIGVFTVNKMAKMVTSVRAAGGELRAFAGVAAGVAKRVAASFGLQSTAAEESAVKVGSAQAEETTAVTASSSTVQAENAATGRSFTMVGTSTVASTAVVDSAVAGEAGAVTAADTTIEAENAAAALSFSAMLGPIAAVVAALSNPTFRSTAWNFAKGKNLTAVGTVTGAPIGSPTPASGGFHDSGTNSAGAGRVSTTPAYVPPHISGAVGGLTAKQRKQLAALTSGAGTAATGGGGASGSHAGGANWQRIAQALSGMGVSDVGIAGALGNFGAEAGGMTVKGISTTATNPSSGAYGFAQWLGARLTGLKSYAKSKGLAASSIDAQIGFLEKELRGTEHGTLAALKGASTPAQAAQIFEKAFERGGVSSGNMAQRENLAAQALGLLTGSKSVKVPLYANPFAHAHGLHVGQTDMGVDYSMTPGSKIGAIGAGKVLGVTGGFQDPGGGNPNNGTYIAYQLTQGPNKGKVVYVAEQINSKVHTGEHLVAGQTIGTYASHGSGIEMGLANPRNWRQTLAAAHGHGAYAVRHAPGGTVEGQMFAAMLHGIGSGISTTLGPGGTSTVKLSPQEKKFLDTEKLVTSQQNAFNKWLAGQRATESVMTAAQRNALNQEIAIKRSALGIQTAREFASTITLTKQQKHSLDQQTSDQRLGVAVMGKLVAASHDKNLKSLEANVAHINQAGFTGLIKRLEHSHTSGFAALAKQLVAVHKKAMDHLAAETLANQKKTDAKIAAGQAKIAADADKAWAAVIGYTATLSKDQADAQVQAIQDATKVTLDQQGEVGKTGADLIAAQAQTHLDQVTQTQNALVASAQQSFDTISGADGSTETQKAKAAADLQTAQSNAAIAEAQAQAALDLDNAAASAADAAASSADAASSAADVVDSTPVGAPGLPSSPTFNFTINGHQMTAADLFAEVGWALKTGSLPVAA